MTRAADTVPSASPVNRAAPCAPTLRCLLAIAARLADLSRGRRRRGVILRRSAARGRAPGRCTTAAGQRSFTFYLATVLDRPGAPLMVELLGIVDRVLCFAFAFALICALDRV